MAEKAGRRDLKAEQQQQWAVLMRQHVLASSQAYLAQEEADRDRIENEWAQETATLQVRLWGCAVPSGLGLTRYGATSAECPVSAECCCALRVAGVCWQTPPPFLKDWGKFSSGPTAHQQISLANGANWFGPKIFFGFGASKHSAPPEPWGRGTGAGTGRAVLPCSCPVPPSPAPPRGFPALPHPNAEGQDQA